MAFGLAAFAARAEDIPEIMILGEKIPVEGDLRKGALLFHPYVASREIYNDNVYYRKEDRIADFLEALTPGLRLEYPFAKEHELRLDWQSTVCQYHDRSELDWQNEHLGRLALNLDWERGFLKVGDRFAILEEVGDPQFTERLRRWLNDAVISGGLRFKPLDVRFDYSYLLRRWFHDRFHDLNYATHVAGTRLDFKFFNTLKPYARYEFRRTDFDGDWGAPLRLLRRNDQEEHRAVAGLAHEVSEELRYEVGVGVQHLSLEDYNLAWRPYLGHRESTHLFFDASLSWRPKSEIVELSAFFVRRAELATQADYHDLTMGGVELSRKWSSRLTTRVGASYANYDNPRAPDIGYFSAHVSVLYRINTWASLIGRYERRDRDTKGSSSDYGQNVLTIGGIFAW